MRKWAQADGYKDYQKVSSQEGFAHFYSELTQKFLVDVPHTEVGSEWDLEAVRSQLITYRRSLHTIHSRGRKVTSFFICLFFLCLLHKPTHCFLPNQQKAGQQRKLPGGGGAGQAEDGQEEEEADVSLDQDVDQLDHEHSHEEQQQQQQQQQGNGGKEKGKRSM